ncbi:MAG: hypothetical protein Q8909_10585, partial [Bacteroidota bacterium]|nr:hypothetical protein [Bacteroidota bacterium]
MKKLFCVVVILFNLNTKFYAQKTTISLLADTSSNLGARKIGSRDIYNKSYIKNLMKDVFHWQINNPVLINDFKEQWARSVFYSGIM